MTSSDTDTIRTLIQKKDADGSVRHGAEWLQLWSDPHALKSAEEKHALAAMAMQRERSESAIAANMRALSGKSDLDILFTNKDAVSRDQCCLPPLAGPFATSAERGYSDLLALLIRHPRGPHSLTSAKQNQIETRFWAARSVALGLSQYPGVSKNIMRYAQSEMTRTGLAHSLLAADMPLDQVLIWLTLHSFHPHDGFLMDNGGLEMWWGWFGRHVPALFDDMRLNLEDRQLFAAACGAAANRLLAHYPDAQTQPLPFIIEDANNAEETNQDQVTKEAGADDASRFGEPHRRSATPPLQHQSYHIFTRQHDEVVPIQALMSEAELIKARMRLDQSLAEQTPSIRKAASELRRLLESKTLREWSFDQHEGQLDAGRLSRVVVNPFHALSFKTEEAAPTVDCAITLLIDNSGSMRGQHITQAAMSADIIASILSECRIPFEVLGFTTRGFRGGKSYKDWVSAGKPANPGRLCDLLHVIYKEADQPWRKAKADIAGLYTPPFLAENIDGEALAWAAGRLMRRSETRRILIVISDGAPADKTTLEHNQDTSFLLRHTYQTIQQCRAQSIEVKAIGIGYDVSHLYADTLTLENADMLAETLLHTLHRLFIY